MALAFNQITITDLTDIATYFYYSPNSNGSDATIAPEPNSKYIGIYSGEPVSSGQPNPKGDNDNKEKYNGIKGKILWSEYKGQPGETPVFDRTDRWYYLSDKPKDEYTDKQLNEEITWGDLNVIPDIEGSTSARYLLIRNQDHWKIGNETQDSDYYYDQSYIGADGADGADANVYEIVTDPEEIVRYTESSDKISYKIKFYQDVIDFYPYEFKDDHKVIVSTDDFDDFKICLFLFLQESTNSSKIVALDFKYLASQYSEIFTIDKNNCKWSINIKNILTNNTEEGETQYPELETSNHEVALLQRTPIGFIKYYLGENLLSSIIGVRLYNATAELNFENYQDNYSFSKNDGSLSKKNILIRNSLPEDVAKFYLHAADITMAVNEAGLKFDGNGLTLNNGNLTIYNKKIGSSDGYEQVLYFDDNTGNMVIKGTIYADNGIFNGVVNATDGFFNGTLEAENGNIGGFNIVNNYYYRLLNSDEYDEEQISNYYEKIIGDDLSTKYEKTKDSEINNSKEYYAKVTTENYLISSDENIKLDGLNGIIEAEEIKLGKKAKITDSIELGGEEYSSAFIYNPDVNNGKFIEAGDLKISNDGIINSGAITIDGTTSKINIGDSIVFDGLNKTLSSNSWKIAPDKSEFNNVVIKGSIEAASFEYGEVTTVGGILFIKASSAITDVDTNTNMVTIKYVNGDQTSTGLFAVGDICCFSTNLSDSSLSNSTIWRITKVTNNSESTTLTLEIYNNDNNKNNANNLTTDLIGGSIYKIGTLDEDNELSDNLGIGINSSSNPSFLPSQSLSIVELTKENNNFKYINRLILGNLTSIGETDYGLYADNVILNGKLVSKNKDDLTAGINSKGQGKMPSDNDKFPWHSSKADKEGYLPSGKIILWAGGKGSTSATDARFKVDENGNLYSSSGYFNGAIVTDSIIESAELRTAIITGTGAEGYGLTIRNVTDGILFRNENESGYYFKLNNETTDINTPTVKAKGLYISEGYATFKDNFSFNDISIFGKKISYMPNNISDSGAINLSESGETYIGFDNKQIDFFGKVMIEDDYTKIKNNINFTNNEITYDKGKVRIEVLNQGYDVYVSE